MRWDDIPVWYPEYPGQRVSHGGIKKLAAMQCFPSFVVQDVLRLQNRWLKPKEG